MLLSLGSTVPTIQVSYPLLPLSTYAITTLLLLLSNVGPMTWVFALSNTTGVPKLIDVPLTVPTTAVP